MREWNLTADNPLSLRFAADARLGSIDYVDDQSWEIAFGGPQEPGLSIQTRYGGRAGLARLVPMWIVDGRPIYEGAAFAARPVLRAFASNYAKISIRLLPTLTLNAELWVMDSHAIGGRFVMENSAAERLSLSFELFAQVVREGSPVNMNLLGLDDHSEALHMGVIGNLNPILLMDYATASGTQPGQHVSPKLSAPLTIPAKGWSTIRWVHIGLPSLNESLQTAFQWLYQTNWDDGIAQIAQINAPLPVVETGNADWDAAIAFSQQIVLRSFVGPTENLPNPSFVSARIPSRGFSPHRDGSDHGWEWNGQTALLGYLALPAAAMLTPDLARGAVRNALAVRHDDGWIDFKPGLGGQRANLLSTPLWAATAWRVYEITEDKAFIAEVFPGLARFFERWFQADMDRDQDGVPEWTSVIQSGYADNPTFARFRRWAHNADINKAESPDLAAMLINEARCLLQMADLLGDTAAAGAIQARRDTLLKQLETMWSESTGSYQYRDRDTNQTLAGQTLFRGKGDERYDAHQTLNPPNRLIVRVIGGRDHAPRVTAIIEGVDVQGKHVSETIPPTGFAWYIGMGAAVTEHVYSQINYARLEGLSRVYSYEIETVDLRRQNQTLLLPLWAAAPDKDHAARLLQTITDPAKYERPFGMPICPADDPAFAPDNDEGSGGVWLLWNTLIIEGLLQYGYTKEAAALFGRLLDAQIRALRRDRAFREGYNSETGDGLGDLDDLSGVVPLQLVMQLIGLRIINSRKIWAGGIFALPKPVKVTQFGVEVSRSASGTSVRFSSGHTAEVGPEWQVIEDPTPPPAPPVEPPAAEQPAPASPETSPAAPPAPPNLPTPIPESIIPVDAKKDDTLEIPVSQIDFSQPKDKETKDSTPDKPAPTTGTPGVIKIPVKGPKDGE